MPRHPVVMTAAAGLTSEIQQHFLPHKLKQSQPNSHEVLRAESTVLGRRVGVWGGGDDSGGARGLSPPGPSGEEVTPLGSHVLNTSVSIYFIWELFIFLPLTQCTCQCSSQPKTTPQWTCMAANSDRCPPLGRTQPRDSLAVQ